MRLPPHEAQARVYRALSEAAVAGRRAPTIPALTKIADCCVRTVMVAIKALERDGKITRRGNPQYRTYLIAATGLETAKNDWRRPSVVALGSAAQAVLAMLSGAAAKGEPAPTRRDMRVMLALQGMEPTKTELSDALRGLVRAGAIAVTGRVYSRVYRILATGQSTTVPVRYRPVAKARPKVRAAVPKPDAPPPAPPPVNAYDANLVLGPPRRISGPSDAMRPVRGVRSPYGNFSLTGNAGEMCAG